MSNTQNLYTKINGEMIFKGLLPTVVARATTGPNGAGASAPDPAEG